MLVRIFWRVVDITPETDLNQDSVDAVISRTRGGLYTSDMVSWRSYQHRRDNRRIEEHVAYIETVILRENDIAATPDVFANLNRHNEIVIDDQLSDRENSKTISDALNLTNDGQPVYLQMHQIRPDMTANVLPNNLIINYSVWCVVHNKLMISANNIFGGYIYSCNINEPATVNREFFIMYPDYVVDDWSRKWSITVTRNNRLEIIKSFNKYYSAQKAANRYLRKITGDKRRPLHDFRMADFVHTIEETGDELIIRAIKEKELN